MTRRGEAIAICMSLVMSGRTAATMPGMSDDRPAIKYLNTDLDLVAVRDLTPLANALDARGVFPLSVQQDGGELWYATLEISANSHDARMLEPEATILVMLDAIEALDGEAKELWSACSKREMNIGYDCGDVPWAFNNRLANSTLRRIADVGTSLRITLYPYREPS